MDKIIQKLDSKSEASLKKSIGRSIQTIMSGNFEMDVNMKIIISTTISIGLSKNEYLIISNDWVDTPEEAIDYYFLDAKIEKVPADIKTKDDPNLKNSLIHYPNFSSISLGVSNELIEVNIYEKEHEGDEEVVLYDSGILFTRQDQLSFLIKNDDSITGYLKIIIDPEQIGKELSDLKLRLTIK
jgi:hypothetical protein